MKVKNLASVLVGIIGFFIWSAPQFWDWEISWLEELKLKSIDYRFLMRGSRNPSGDVVNILIDGKSIQELGRWPWDRSVFARIILQLQEYKVRTVVFDLLFTEPENNKVQEAVRSLIQTYVQIGLLNPDPRTQVFMEEMDELLRKEDNDRLLAGVMKNAGNVVLPMAFEYGRQAEGFVPGIGKAAYSNFQYSEELAEMKLESMPRTLVPLNDFTLGAANMGFVNFFPDSDGVIRQGKVALIHNGAVFQPLALATVISGSAEEGLPLLNGRGWIKMPNSRIQYNREGDVYLDFYGPSNSFPSYSFIDILDGQVSRHKLEDKIVLIGGATTGLGDMWSTPLANKIWGIELQSTFVENILNQQFLREPENGKACAIGSIAFLSAVIVILMIVFSPIWSTGACLMTLAAYCTLSQYLFESYSLLWPTVLPLMGAMSIFFACLVFNYFFEGRQKKHVKKLFSRYLSKDLVKILVDNPKMANLGGEELELTVLFSDIRNFTTLSEKLTPVELTRLLNMYLESLTDVILEHGGTLDKYIGDAIMAIFGAPVPRPLHPLQACQAAITMCELLHDKRQIWEKEGWPHLRLGVGINTGEMVIGNMGSKQRFDYTVIGNEVNIASRLEGLTKVYRVKIIISQGTKKYVENEVRCRELDWVKVKGINEPQRIYELLGKDYFTQGKYTFITVFEEALQLYRSGDFKAADKAFARVEALKPDDGPTSLFRQRCNYLMRNDPGSEWDGIWEMKVK